MHEDAKVRQQDRKAKKAESRRRAVNVGGNVADWATADAEILRWAIACVARQGGAVRLGYTRDGGAYAIGILGDGEPYTEYVKPSESIDEYLRSLGERWTE